MPEMFYLIAVPKHGSVDWVQWKPDMGIFIFKEMMEPDDEKAVELQDHEIHVQYAAQLDGDGYWLDMSYRYQINQHHPWMVKQWEDWLAANGKL